MNSGPMGRVIVSRRMRSISALSEASSVQPAHFGCRLQLVGITCAPQRRGDALVECPANGQVNDSFSKAVLGQLIQAVHGGEILSKAGLLELRVGPFAGRRQ